MDYSEKRPDGKDKKKRIRTVINNCQDINNYFPFASFKLCVLMMFFKCLNNFFKYLDK